MNYASPWWPAAGVKLRCKVTSRASPIRWNSAAFLEVSETFPQRQFVIVFCPARPCFELSASQARPDQVRAEPCNCARGKIKHQHLGREYEETVFDPHGSFHRIRSESSVSGDCTAQACPNFQAAARSQRKLRPFCDRSQGSAALRHAGGLQIGLGL